MLNIQIKNEIKQHALENKGMECCGLILQSGNSTLIYKCRNISSNSSAHFELSPLDYLRGWQGGKNKIVGFYHSQLSPKPSLLDIIAYNNHKIPSYIYSFESDDIIEVTNQHSKYSKYLGREFEIGKRDCFSLLRDFYKEEFNINIKDYFRDDKWLITNPKMSQDIYQKENFEKIPFESISEGDIIEFNFGHFGIYLNGDLLIHHNRNKYSSIDKLDNSWKSRITNCYKYVKTS